MQKMCLNRLFKVIYHLCKQVKLMEKKEKLDQFGLPIEEQEPGQIATAITQFREGRKEKRLGCSADNVIFELSKQLLEVLPVLRGKTDKEISEAFYIFVSLTLHKQMQEYRDKNKEDMPRSHLVEEVFAIGIHPLDMFIKILLFDDTLD